MTLGEWLEREPFTLALSSGFFGFFAHCGLLMALEDHGLRPARLSGSSAGALIGGLSAAGLSGKDIAEVLTHLRRQDFWDPFPGPGLLRGRRFRRILESSLPVTRFADCPRPVTLSAWDVLGLSTRAFDSGNLVPAIQASCSVPLLFHPVWIKGRPYVDGGIGDRPGIAGIPPGERVFHHHLAGRSPWRRRHSPALRPPEAPGLRSLTLPDLPRSGPTRLDAGRSAMREAYAGTVRALERQVGEIGC